MKSHQSLGAVKHFTPLRYPGGKGKLAPLIKSIIVANRLLDGEYAEPYAGGAGIALELLFHDYVSHIHINDFSRPVHAFWKSVLNQPEKLTRLIHDTPLTVRSWDKQKKIFAHESDHSDLEVGFAVFFLNRTNRSGILNGGIIGGRDQGGPWKIDARFNKKGLIERIEAVARMKRRISVTQMDALKFLKTRSSALPAKTLIYLDPPYYVKGSELYYDFYQHEDHERLEKFVASDLTDKNWIVSYDNVPTIRKLYNDYRHVVYRIGYSARSAREGAEIMFFSDKLSMVPLVGPIKLVRSRLTSERRNVSVPRKSSKSKPAKRTPAKVLRR
ncbi:MAG TPA: DNA adenine methylase [Rhizomicrobium sp.]|jgi:DNA adenine methylase